MVLDHTNSLNQTSPNTTKKKRTVLNDQRILELKEKLAIGRLSLQEYMLAAANRIKPSMDMQLYQIIAEDFVNGYAAAAEGEVQGIGPNEIFDAPQDNMFAPEEFIDENPHELYEYDGENVYLNL